MEFAAEKQHAVSVPDDLRDRRQWLIWRFETQPGDKKPRKVPYYAKGTRRTGTQGSDDDRAKLVDYDTAVLQRDAHGADGIGFAFLPDDGLIGIDLDGCIDCDDSERRSRAAKIVAGCNSFSEYSPSGNGFHIFVRGKTQTFKSNELGIEVFCGRQFFTFTGNHVPNTPLAINELPTDKIEKLRALVKSKAAPTSGVSQLPVVQADTAKIESALAFISPDCGYDDWYKVGMAIQAELGDAGASVWDWWSRKSQKYCGENEILSHWRSFNPGGRVTGGTLFKMAMDAGWRPPQQPRGAIRDVEQLPPEDRFDPEAGEITGNPANDNQPVGDTAEKVLSKNMVIQGQSTDGLYWILDKRRSSLRYFKASELTRKSTLIELAPSDVWEAAIGLHLNEAKKFTTDAAFEVIVGISSNLPAYVPAASSDDSKPRGTLSGMHAADSHIIAEQIRGRMLYDEYSQGWYSWDTIWHPATMGDVERALMEVMDDAFARMYNYSAFTGTFSMMKKRLGRSPQLNADGSAAYDTWNREKHLLPMRNGVLDIRTGDLLPHSPSLMMPWMLPHDYDQDATCPVTEDFMRQLSQGDKATETVLYCFLAALLHGRADLQKYLECIGLAGTGKSTYIRLCTALVGDANVAITTMKQLHENRFETANIYGKRLVVISDADKYGGSVDVFKAITGEDPIRYEEKNKQPGKPFIFGGMVIVAGNQPIQFNDNSTAMVRRRIPIHLDARLDKSRVDIALSDKMQAEMPGLVNKLLSYTQADIASALKDTQQRRAMAERRSMCETNPIAAWINEMLIQDLTGKAQVGLSSNNASECLYPNYAKYCDDTGRKGIVGLQSFSRSVLDILGYVGIPAEKKREGAGTYIYGVRLRGVYDDGIPSMMVSDTY